MSPLWSYGLAAVGVLGLWLAGSGDWVRRQAGWAIGLAAQVLWIAYALATDQPGFIVTALVYGAVYARNWRRARDTAGRWGHRVGLDGQPLRPPTLAAKLRLPRGQRGRGIAADPGPPLPPPPPPQKR